MSASVFVRQACIVVLVAICLARPGTGHAVDQIERLSERDFDGTIQHLQWAFGGFGLTVVTALDYQQILKRIKVDTGRAAMFEVMRREWAKALLQMDPALGAVLPIRIYVFESNDGGTRVRYLRPGAQLEAHGSEAVRALARELDDKLSAVIEQALVRPGTSSQQP